MVLICNNNILTIEKFHKHRCEEKAAIQSIIVNERKYDEKYKEKPAKEVTRNMNYIETTKDLPTYCRRAIRIPNDKSKR